MNSDISMTNVGFDVLGKSAKLLNLILDNISSYVLLLDRNMRLKAYNDSLKTIFSKRKGEDLLHIKCGEAIGCAHQIEEKNCGNTSQCFNCDLRISALNSYSNNEVIYKKHIIKPFFTYNHKKVDKHLQFSTRLFNYNEEKYILMIIDDISYFKR